MGGERPKLMFCSNFYLLTKSVFIYRIGDDGGCCQSLFPFKILAVGIFIWKFCHYLQICMTVRIGKFCNLFHRMIFGTTECNNAFLPFSKVAFPAHFMYSRSAFYWTTRRPAVRNTDKTKPTFRRKLPSRLPLYGFYTFRVLSKQLR